MILTKRYYHIEVKRMSITEAEFLSSYRIEDYDRPSSAVDIAAFSIRSDAAESYKHDSTRRLALLLVKRGEHPFKDRWALPGGFLRKGETLEQCAMREITEEAGVTPVSLMPSAVFSDTDRDPRGWILSHSFVSVMSEEELMAVSGDDAVDARWFGLDFAQDGDRLTLTLDGGDTVIKAELRETGVRFGNPDYEVELSGGLAFDHARIIAVALGRLRRIAEDFDILFDFLPPRFTIASLQRVQEAILGITLTAANFRRKVSPYIEETEEYVTGAGHRPAKLFTRKK